MSREIKERLKEFLCEGPERVGFVLNDNTIVEVENEASDPDNSFSVSPETILEYEDRIAASWHTHPRGSCNLSVDDMDGFRAWPDWMHYVIGVDGVRAFRVHNGKVLHNA